MAWEEGGGNERGVWVVVSGEIRDHKLSLTPSFFFSDLVAVCCMFEFDGETSSRLHNRDHIIAG